MRTLLDSRSRLVAAAIAAVGMSVVGQSAYAAAPTVAFILSINDDGQGDVVAGDYAVYAAESGAGTYGFDGIGVNIGAVTNPSDFLEDDLPDGTATPGTTNTAKKAPAVTVGFNEGYGASYPIGGAQDTPDLSNSLAAGKPPAAFLIYGVGQTLGSVSAAVLADNGGKPPPYMPLPTSTGTDAYGVSLTIDGVTFPGAVLVADGTYAPGETPAFIANNNSALLFTENGQANFNPAGGNTESIGESGITFLSKPPEGPPLPIIDLDDSNNNGGMNDGTITESPGNGNYAADKIVVSPANNKGYFSYSGFTAGDPVDVALKFTSGGNAIGASEIAALIAYINANDNGEGTIASDYSSAPAAVQQALGTGAYDILLSDMAGANDPFANYDFTGFTADASLEVSGIGVVPEPAGLGLLALGSVGLVRGRRHQRANA